MEIRDNNYVTLLGWMRTELDLTGSELIIYALIYMVSQTDKQDYYATQEYAAEWAGVSLRSVRNNINSLIEKELIEKVTRCIDGKYITTYRVTDYHKPERKKFPAEKSGTERKKFPTNIKRTIYNSNDIDFLSLQSEHTNKSTTIKSEVDYTNSSKTTTKQDKIPLKNKIIHLIDEYTDNDGLRKSLYDFVEMREKQKKPVPTEHAMELLLKSLTNLCGNDTKRKTATVDKAIMKCWLSFYPLKQEDLMSMEERQTDLDDIF